MEFLIIEFFWFLMNFINSWIFFRFWAILNFIFFYWILWNFLGSNGVKGDVPLAEDETAFEDIEEDVNPEPPKRPKMDIFWDNVKILLNQCFDSLFGTVEKWIERRWGPIEERFFYNNTTEVIWSIDSMARKLFPLVFLLLQIMYWTSYLYLLSDE